MATLGTPRAIGRLVVLSACVAALLLGGCGGGSAAVDTSPVTPEPSSRLEPGGVVVGLVFNTPLPLDDARALAESLGGDILAVYRTDYACVRPITGGMPQWQPEASRFAYVDAGGIRKRRIAAVAAGLSPPITGQLIAESYWLHWEDQWAKAQEPGASFTAMAVYVSEASVEALRNDPRFQAVEIIPHRRTDSLDPEFPGELLLESEEFPPGVLSSPPVPDCGG